MNRIWAWAAWLVFAVIVAAVAWIVAAAANPSAWIPGLGAALGALIGVAVARSLARHHLPADAQTG